MLLTLILPLELVTSPTYNISITKTTVGKNVSALEFSAIFDSGTSFTSLKDPAYTFISESVSNLNVVFPDTIGIPFYNVQVYMIYVILQFNSQVLERRHPYDSQNPFEYCYDLRSSISEEKPIPVLY